MRLRAAPAATLRPLVWPSVVTVVTVVHYSSHMCLLEEVLQGAARELEAGCCRGEGRDSEK